MERDQETYGKRPTLGFSRGSPVATCQTRISDYGGMERSAGDAALSAYAELYGRMERKLFAEVAAGRSAASLKSGYLKRYGIPARMFNGVRVSLEGKIASVREGQELQVENQANRLWAYAGQRGILLDQVVSEIASGLNDRRPKLRKPLGDPTVHTVIVEHRERLARFGVGMVEAMLEARGGSLIVIDDAEVPDDLVQDMTEILTCFCARLYGKRSAANRARRAIEVVSG